MEMKKYVGDVTPLERDELYEVFRRRNGLNELARILTADNGELYERLVRDMGETSTRFQKWWDDMAAKYNWESAPDGSWEIDFNACKVYLVTSD